ncbi:GNAT family N-acetyltransferase [bacterium]|nr:GNAT family N-acetyltransferase [bacterium]
MDPAYTFELLDSQQVVGFQHLSYPIYRPQLRNAAQSGTLVAIGVSDGTRAVGLVLADHPRDSRLGVVLSLYVTPQYRRRGLGKTLFGLLGDELRRRGCFEAKASFMDGTPSTPGVERILSHHDWSQPLERVWVCTGTRESIVSLPWLQDLPLPEAFEMFPWNALRDDERQALLEQEAVAPGYPAILSPFREEHLLEPLNSLGLRYRGQVVGWLITHRIAPDTIRYTSLFVREELQALGRAIPLVARAIRLQLEDGGANKGTFAVLVQNRAMANFIHRRLAPHLASIRKSWESSLSVAHLGSSAASAGS